MRFDFGRLGVGRELTAALRDAFLVSFAHNSETSLQVCWASLRKFASYLQLSGLADVLPLPASIAADFRDWLESLGHSAVTNQGILNRCLIVLGAVERLRPDLLASGIRLRVERFNVETRVRQPVLSAVDVKNILKACQAEISIIEDRLLRTQSMLGADPQRDGGFAALFQELIALGGGKMPSQASVLASKRDLKRRVSAAGGLRSISRSVWLCPEAFFPFYLAILIQTGGNSSSILHMRRDCVVPHPLRSDLERVVWDKLRSGREQHAEAPTGRLWSAAGLVRRLARLNANLCDAARPRDRDRLFLAYPLTGKVPRVISSSLLHLELMDFIRRNQLPRFALKDLRRADALAHHQVTATLRGAQRRLGHASVATTARYTRLDDLRDRHDKTIQRFQGRLLRECFTEPRQGADSTSPQEGTSSSIDTVFGFACGNPYRGTAPGSTKGELCLQFHRCATCPGSLIPLDDVRVVARLVATHRVLQEVKRRAMVEGWAQRFEMLYEPTRQILERDILPVVDSQVRTRAESIADEGLVPRLE